MPTLTITAEGVSTGDSFEIIAHELLSTPRNRIAASEDGRRIDWLPIRPIEVGDIRIEATGFDLEVTNGRLTDGLITDWAAHIIGPPEGPTLLFSIANGGWSGTQIQRLLNAIRRTEIDDPLGAIKNALFTDSFIDQFGNNEGNAFSGFDAAETIRAEGGDDSILGSTGTDDINGGPGFDSIDYRGVTSLGGLTLDLDGPRRNAVFDDGTEQRLRNLESVVATLEDDSIDGGADAEALDLSGGDDRATGGSGNDTIIGGAGDDVIAGGRGKDVLHGDRAGASLEESGNDILRGNAGADTLSGGRGSDTIIGGTGNDRLLGDAGEDFLSGGRGNDWLEGGTGPYDLLRGEGGDDTLVSSSNASELYGGIGDDLLIATGGNDTLDGGAGNDRFEFDFANGNDLVLGLELGEVLSFSDPSSALRVRERGDDTVLRINGATVTLNDIDSDALMIAAPSPEGGFAITILEVA